jgi:hypothetical protein
MNESNLDFNKNTLLFDSVRNKFDLVDVEKHYPVNDMQDITLSLDVVIMRTEDFHELLNSRRNPNE